MPLTAPHILPASERKRMHWMYSRAAYSGQEDDEPLILLPLAAQVRKRPLNRRELSRSEFDVIAIHHPSRLTVQEPKTKV